MDAHSTEIVESASSLPFEFGWQAKAVTCRVFLALQQRNPDLTYWDLCVLTGTFVSKSKFTVDRILSEAIASGQVGEPAARSGRPRIVPSSLHDEVLAIVRRFLEMPKDISFRFVYQQLQGRHESVPSYAAFVDQMHSWGFCFGTPHEEPAALKEGWLLERVRTHAATKLSHRSSDGLPVVPELYIDESYCSTHYHRHATVYHPDLAPIALRAPGEGELVVILGAAVARTVGGKLVVDWVPDSYCCWLHKSQTSESSAADTAVRKRRRSGEVGLEGYQGSVNAQVFESWLERTCITAKELYGSCRLYLDNARYHKRQVEPAPSSASRKADMIEWLTSHDLPLPSHPIKKNLMEIIRQHRDEFRVYAAAQIAQAHGHTAHYLPQYYPQLNMMETLWALLKAPIASGPTLTGARLRERLIELHRTACPQKAMEGAYTTMQVHEDLLLSDAQVRLDLAELGLTAPY